MPAQRDGVLLWGANDVDDSNGDMDDFKDDFNDVGRVLMVLMIAIKKWMIPKVISMMLAG